MSYFFVNPLSLGTATFRGNVTINGNLQVDGTTTLVGATDAGQVIIDITNTEALLVRQNADAADIFIVDTTNSNVQLPDDVGLHFGTGEDGQIRWETADADAHYLSIAVTAVSRNIIISEDTNVDWGHAASTDPTLFIHSADSTDVNDFLSLAHNQTNSVLLSGNGGIVTSDDIAIGASLTTAPAATLYIVHPDGVSGGLRLQTNETDATNKIARIKMGHYTNAEEPVTLFISNSTSATNVLNIGGNSSVENALTTIQFFTASTNTTVTGTERGRINQNGVWIFGSGEGGITATTGQSLRAPNVATGGAGNIAGADLTIAAGLGTGTGDEGTIIFSLPIQAGAGDNIQTTATRLTFDMAGSSTVLSMVAAQAMTVSAAAGAITLNAPSGIVLQDDSVTAFRAVSDGTTATWDVASGDNILIATTGQNSSISFTQTAGTTGTTGFTFNIGAHTAITAATERIGINVPAVTKTWALGAGPLATQREVVFVGPTYVGDVGGALTITDAATVAITAAPTQGANITLSNTYALWVQAGTSRFDGAVIFGGGLHFTDDDYASFGNTQASPDAAIGWNTAQTADGWYFGTADAQNTLVIAEYGDRAFDFAHAAQTNPTVFIHSAAQNSTQFIALAHDQTDALLRAGTGSFDFNALLQFSTGQAITAGDYQIGRNADGTNLMQFNVPTGAGYEWSVNDVAELLLTTTYLSPSANGGLDLGQALVSFNDLFLLATGVINWGNGNFIINNNAAGRLTLTPTTTTFGAGDSTITLNPTYNTENFSHIGMTISATQNGANSAALLGLAISLTKATGASILAESNSIAINTPTVTGTITLNIGIDIASQTDVNITTSRAIRIQGTGASNAIELGDSPLIYSDAADRIRIADNTDAGGVQFITAAGGDVTINNIDTSDAQIVFQTQTISRTTAGAAVRIDPTFATSNTSNSILSLIGTQNGANSIEFNGLSIALTKATGATILAAMQGIEIGIPGITGTVTDMKGIQIDNQGNASATNSYAIDIASQSGSATTNRAVRIQGTGTGNAIELGDSPLIYSSGAEVIRLDDSTGARGITLTLTAAGAQTLGASAGNLQINQASGAGIVFNSGGIDNDFTILSDNNASIFVIDGALDIMSLGEAVNTATTLNIDFPTRVAAVGATESALLFSSRLTEAASGTHSALYGTLFDSFSLTAGDGSTTTATTLGIAGAPSGATNNYSLFVVSGVSRFGGNISTAANADIDMSAGGRFFGGGVQINSQTLAGNTNLTMDENDGHVEITTGASSNNTITLPAASGNEGMIVSFYIVSDGGFDAVIQRAGADTIENGSADTGNTQVTLNDVSDYLMLQCVASTRWQVVVNSGGTVA